jgi:hypothetical protein
VSFYNRNRVDGHIGSPDSDESASKFLRAFKFAEARDIVYYERNYVNWRYADQSFSATVPTAGNVGDTENTIKVARGANVTGVPVGRVAIRIGSAADSDIFRGIDQDRKIEFNDKYGRGKVPAERDDFEDYSGNKPGDVRKAYRRLRDTRKAEKANLGETTVDAEDGAGKPDLDARGN